MEDPGNEKGNLQKFEIGDKKSISDKIVKKSLIIA